MLLKNQYIPIDNSTPKLENKHCKLPNLSEYSATQNTHSVQSPISVNQTVNPAILPQFVNKSNINNVNVENEKSNIFENENNELFIDLPIEIVKLSTSLDITTS